MYYSSVQCPCPPHEQKTLVFAREEEVHTLRSTVGEKIMVSPTILKKSPPATGPQRRATRIRGQVSEKEGLGRG